MGWKDIKEWRRQEATGSGSDSSMSDVYDHTRGLMLTEFDNHDKVILTDLGDHDTLSPFDTTGFLDADERRQPTRGRRLMSESEQRQLLYAFGRRRRRRL